MCLLIGNDAVILLLRLRQRPSSTLFPYTTLFRSVDFWAEWCGPCKQLGPGLEKAVSTAKGKVKLVKMDIDKHPAIPGQMGIQSIPAVIAFVNGQPADGFMGALPESQVNDFIARITKDKLGGEAQDLLKLADEALGAGNAVEAVELYAEI